MLPAPACSNCGSAVVNTFCADCGERQPSHRDYSVRGLALDAAHELTSLDGKLVRSVIALLTKPGMLTRDWFEGRRGRYVKPFSLFLLINVAFFIIQPHTQLLSYKFQNYMYGNDAGALRRIALMKEKRAKLGDTPQQFETRFNATLQDQKKTLLIFDIPVLAIVMAIIYAWRRRYFAEHLVFSIHTYAFLLVFLGAVVPLVYSGLFRLLSAAHVPLASLQWAQGDLGISLLLVAVMGPYLYLALRRVYGDGRLGAAIRAAILFFVIGQLTTVYHDVLFYTTLYSL
jgi:hypothetical protein